MAEIPVKVTITSIVTRTQKPNDLLALLLIIAASFLISPHSVSAFIGMVLLMVAADKIE